MVSMSPPAGNRSAKQVQALAAGIPTIFRSERPALVSQLVFYSATTLSAASVRIETDGQSWAQNTLIPLPLLATEYDVQSSVMGFVYRVKLRVPIVWTQELPITITCSAGATVYVDGDVVSQ